MYVGGGGGDQQGVPQAGRRGSVEGLGPLVETRHTVAWGGGHLHSEAGDVFLTGVSPTFNAGQGAPPELGVEQDAANLSPQALLSCLPLLPACVLPSLFLCLQPRAGGSVTPCRPYVPHPTLAPKLPAHRHPLVL